MCCTARWSLFVMLLLYPGNRGWYSLVKLFIFLGSFQCDGFLYSCKLDFPLLGLVLPRVPTFRWGAGNMFWWYMEEICLILPKWNIHPYQYMLSLLTSLKSLNPTYALIRNYSYWTFLYWRYWNKTESGLKFFQPFIIWAVIYFERTFQTTSKMKLNNVAIFTVKGL